MIIHAISIPRSELPAIARHVENVFPHEACGVIAGKWRVNVGYISQFIPITNVAQHPETTYYMDERALASALLGIEHQNLDLIGFYHSHPSGEPVPSSTDIASAAYPDAVYLIVGYKHRTPFLAAWRLRDGGAERVELYEREKSTDNIPILPNAALSPAARMAILISAALAFALLIVIAVSLLPPAPILPAR